MNDLIISFMSMLGTAAGAVTGIIVSNRLTTYRIEQLEKKIEKYAESTDDTRSRLIKLEERFVALEKRVDSLFEN